MANIKTVKRRIKSAQNISQITKAMEMVAAAKMKKAQDTALRGKPYADKINSAVNVLARKVDRRKHVLLGQGNQNGTKLVILISTNKGLCGGLNTNLFRFCFNLLKDVKNLEFVTIGKKGENFVIRWHKSLVADFSQNLPFTASVPAIIQMIVDGFGQFRFREVSVIFNSFISALKQQPLERRILPIGIADVTTPQEEASFAEFLLEPNITEVLNSLLPHYLENQLRTAILEASASEHSARMIAMKNATDAAFDLISELTLVYNKARQEKITYEIADMVTARLLVK